jgi:T5SS/PEP-CTERM-associated repeat protein/autotransporter-associated beta strand protein
MNISFVVRFAKSVRNSRVLGDLAFYRTCLTDRTMTAAAAALVFLILQTSARAGIAAWNNPSLGDWFVATNWVNGVMPSASNYAYMGNGGTALINAPSATAQQLFIGLPTKSGMANGTLLLGASGGNTGALTVGGDIEIGESISAGIAANGNVTISTGALLQQQSGNLYIGRGTQGSAGTLKITDPGSIMTTGAPTYIGLDNSQGNFTIQNGGEIYTGPAELADGASSTGVATVTGTDSSWPVEGGLTVGYAGAGTLTISSGGTVSVLHDVSVAAFTGATGNVTVTGAGSIWYMENLFLGGRDGNSGAGVQGGSASLSITSGGLVQADNVKFFGGALQVDNGSLTTPGLTVVGGKTAPSDGGPVGDMVVGNSTTGRMDITSGGVVLSNKGYVGIVSGSEGYAYVTGNNTQWQLAGSLFVGNQGDGTLEIRDLGDVSTAGNVYIGFSANTVGNIILGGIDLGGGAYAFSNLGASGNLYVGGNEAGAGGSGVLRLETGGAVYATATTVYSNGGLALGSSNIFLHGPLTFLGGFIQFVLADNTAFYNDITLGTGGIRIYTSGHPSTLAGKLSGTGGLTKGGSGSLGIGTLTLTGSSTYTGATAVNVGTLLVNGSITSPVTVSSGATLGGSGKVGTVTVNSGGIVSPGNSPGQLTVNGNYVQTSGATLKIELGGASAGSGFDQIAASGIASLGGVLDVSLVNGFRPNVGDTFQIITSNGESGNFSTVSSTSGLRVRSDASATGVVLTIIGIDPLLHVISIGRSGDDILITYDATGGKTYQLERKAAITDANWQPITGVSNQTPPANGPATFTDKGAVSLGKAFYRVSLLAAPGVNLLVNGNAEAGAFSATGAHIAVPGWTTSSAFTVVDYKPGGDTSGFPKTTDAGPPDAAKQFFAGGNAATSTATQPIDVSANAADIDSGNAVVDLSGWLGGGGTDGDNASLKVAFFNGSTNLGGGSIGPVTNVDRGNTTSLLFRSQTIHVPSNTRQLVATLTMNRTAGAFDDGYADSLSVVLRLPAAVTTTADGEPAERTSRH